MKIQPPTAPSRRDLALRQRADPVNRLIVGAVPLALLGILLESLAAKPPGPGWYFPAAGVLSVALGASAFRRADWPARWRMVSDVGLGAAIVGVHLAAGRLWGAGAWLALVASLGMLRRDRWPARATGLLFAAAGALLVWAWSRSAGAGGAVLLWGEAGAAAGLLSGMAVAGAGVWRAQADRLQAAEAALAAADERAAVAFRDGAQASLLFQAGRIVLANTKAVELLGPAVAEGAAPDGLAAPGVETEHWTAALAAAAAGEPRHLSQRLRRRDGARVDAEVYLYPARFAQAPAVWCVIHDTSALHWFAEECRRLKTAAEYTDEAIAITDAASRFVYVNRAFEIITGYARAEVLGQTPRLLHSGEHDATFYRALWSTLRMGGVWTGQFRNRRKDGGVYTEQASITPVTGPSGEVTHYVAVKRDLTTELELQRQLGHGQRMEAIGRLTGGVAHDFNNILQVITGNVALARCDLPADHAIAQSLTEIAAASDRAIVLVRQLLAFSRKEKPQFRCVNVDELLTGLIKMLQRIIGEHIALRYQATSARLFVKGDPGQLEQVLLNLCVNARDAMPRGGRIRIEASVTMIDAALRELRLPQRSAGYVVLSVADTGSGIPPELQERIFEPFFTTKDPGKGTGIGLATVQAIVKSHGGAIALESAVGVGTTFRIFLPATAPVETTDAAPEALVRQRPQGNGEAILLVEDDEAVLRIGTRILGSAGYRVLTARNGDEALAAHAGNAGAISLVVLDMVMPRRNGRDTRDVLLERDPSLPVIFVTGYTDEMLTRGRPITDRVLRKPYASRELLLLVRDTLAARNRHRLRAAVD